MTVAEAFELEVYWGSPGPRPAADWRCCAWCGEWYGPEIRFWRNSHKRVCTACYQAWRVAGVMPRSPRWHAKNRWTIDGHLERYCPLCPRRHRWRPLTAFYRCNMYGHDTSKRRTRTIYPYALCIPCARRAHRRYKLSRRTTT